MKAKPWLDLYPAEISKTLHYESIPLQQYLKRAYDKHPKKTAIHFLGRNVSYSEFYEASLKLANYLRSIGVEKGDRVAIMLPNCPQSAIAYFAILMCGGIVVQTNPLYTERELKYQMKDSGSKVIIALDILYPKALHAVKETPLEQIILTSVKDFLPFPKNLLYPIVQKKQNSISVKVKHRGISHLFTEIMKISKPIPILQPLNAEEDIALIQYTGGTTGPPKGVMLTHKNLIANATMCAAWLYKCEEGEETLLGMLPFFHVYGMTTVLLFSVMLANKMVLIPKFDTELALKTIDKQKPTLFPGAPTMYIGLLNHPRIQNYDLSSIKACLSGSAALPIDVQEQFEKVTGGRLVEGYGLTETSPVTHANFVWVKAKDRRKGSIGVPWPDTDVRIFDPTSSNALKPGEVGELAVKGPQVMKGYWNRSEETENAFRDGWFLTGDLGYMDEAGYFYIVDRKKDMIVAGGFNIYPREIEEVLYEHKTIQECVVAGIPDAYRGETVKAYIVLKKNAAVTAEELDRFCRQQLAAFKVPKQYEFRDELPKTAVGKILRRVLVEEEKRKEVSEK